MHEPNGMQGATGGCTMSDGTASCSWPFNILAEAFRCLCYACDL